MDVMLGVSVVDTDAQIVLLDAAAPHDVIDQSGVDLTGESLDALVSTLVSTDRALTESGHRVVATRVCGANAEQTTALVNSLVDADMSEVTAVHPADAVTAAVRSLAAGQTVASLSAEGDTAALTIVDSETDTSSLIAVEPISDADQASAYRTLLERFSEEPGGATSVIVLGAPAAAQWASEMSQSSTVPLTFPDQPEFVMARGAALAGLVKRQAAAIPALDDAETVLGPQVPQLAYSEVADTGGFDGAELGYVDDADVPMQTPMRPLSAIDPDEVDDTVAGAGPRPKMLLVGSTVAAVVVVGFAALAVSVAINIRPTATQQAIRMQHETVPGKYFPVAPGQGVTPDGPNWTAVETLPPPGVDTGGVRTFETKALNLSSGSIDAAAPRIIQVYRDGTVGLPDPQNLIPTGVPDPINPVAAPAIPEFVPRLIPDLSRVDMTQVIGALGNMQQIPNPAGTARNVNGVVPLNQMAASNNGLGLNDLGMLTAVPSTRGSLFSTDPAASAVKGVGGIPAEVFQTGKTGVDVAQVLPPDTKVLDALPAQVGTGKAGSTPIFGGVIPDLGAVTKPVDAIPGAVVPNLSPVPSGTGGLPDVLPKPDVNLPLPQILPKPDVNLPLPQILPKPDLPQQLPDLPISVPAPKVSVPDLPISIPAPKVSIPDPPVLVPAPKVSIPDPPVLVPAPKVSIPEPPVSIPDLPIKLPVPSIGVPDVPSAPVPQVPSLPSLPIPQIPLIPQLPFGGGGSGGGLFGLG